MSGQKGSSMTAMQVNVEQYIKQIDQITRRHLGKDNIIADSEVGDFISELLEILHEDVRDMIDHKQYESAFEVMNYIFTMAGDVVMDDSDDGLGMLINEAYNLWLELLGKVGKDEKRKMFQWFRTHLNDPMIDYLQWDIEDIIMDEFEEEEYAKENLLYAKIKIETCDKLNPYWIRSSEAEAWTRRYLRFLETQKCSRAEREEFCRSYWKNTFVREYYIDWCVKKKHYDLALQALDESLILDKAYAGLVANYSEKKKEIYLLQGDREAYRKQLWALVLEHEIGDIYIFRELKAQYTKEEWLEKREEIFTKISQYDHSGWMSAFYKEEQLYDRLLDLVLESPDIYMLKSYANILKEDYPEQILQKYAKEVQQMAAYAADQNKYQELVGILRDMQKIKGGKKAAEEIVKEWRVQYKNRPAMMYELNRL